MLVELAHCTRAIERCRLPCLASGICKLASVPGSHPAFSGMQYQVLIQLFVACSTVSNEKLDESLGPRLFACCLTGCTCMAGNQLVYITCQPMDISIYALILWHPVYGGGGQCCFVMDNCTLGPTSMCLLCQ